MSDNYLLDAYFSSEKRNPILDTLKKVATGHQQKVLGVFSECSRHINMEDNDIELIKSSINSTINPYMEVAFENWCKWAGKEIKTKPKSRKMIRQILQHYTEANSLINPDEGKGDFEGWCICLKLRFEIDSKTTSEEEVSKIIEDFWTESQLETKEAA